MYQHGSTARPFVGDLGLAFAVAWSPDGKQVAAGGNKSTILIWDVTSGKLLVRYVGHQQAASSLAWSPDGSRIASGSYDTSVQIWGASTGKLLLMYGKAKTESK